MMCLSDETIKLETTSLIKRFETEALHHAGFLTLLVLSNVNGLSIKSGTPTLVQQNIKSCLTVR